jgi:predicted acylesterase/phospholipase RssA
MQMRRAIALAGGGPVAGLHIGALEVFEKADIKFDVWALSCIGAWVGVIYNQFDDKPAERTKDFFLTHIFRNDDSYARFPINAVFSPDWASLAKALGKYVFSLESYEKLWLAPEPLEHAGNALRAVWDPTRWNEGDLNKLVLETLANNPFWRFWISLGWLNELTGLARINYPQSTFARSISTQKLARRGPFLYHNAWNLSQRKLDLFSNYDDERRGYKKMDFSSLCACSALPFIEETVEIDGDVYCEGALVDTVNFKRLLDDHEPLHEIWVCRIVDAQQIRPPRNLHDALGNLCQLFAATVGDDDVKLFKFHAKARDWPGRIVEMKMSSDLNFEWTHKNLGRAINQGKTAALEALDGYYLINALVRLLSPQCAWKAPGRSDDQSQLKALLERVRAQAHRAGMKELLSEHLYQALGFEAVEEIAHITGIAPREVLARLVESLPKHERESNWAERAGTGGSTTTEAAA